MAEVAEADESLGPVLGQSLKWNIETSTNFSELSPGAKNQNTAQTDNTAATSPNRTTKPDISQKLRDPRQGCGMPGIHITPTFLWRFECTLLMATSALCPRARDFRGSSIIAQ